MSSRENTGRQEAQTLSRESSRSTVGWDQDSVCHPYEVEKFVGPPALRPSRSCPSLVMKTCPALIITRERREDVEERKELEEVKKERRKEEIQRLEKETKWDEAERNGLEEELGRMIERLRKEEEVMEDDSDFDVEEEDDDEEEDEEVDVVNFEEPVDVVKKEPDTVNETVDRPPDAARTQPSFSLPPVNISLQVSKGCRIGPLFDKTRLRSLPPHNSLPYPEEITRIVQDLLRCGHRPRDIFNSIKVAAPGQPFSIVMFFDRINGKLECKNIPVSDSVISARAWLSEFLESVGCCKNLFILDFIADDFICRHCLTRNQEGKGAVAAESKEMTTVVVEEMRTRVEKKRREEEEKRKEEELKIIKEERKEGENEKLKKEQEEAQKEADSKEVTTVVDPRAEDTEHFAYQAIKVEDEEDVLVDVESCEEELIEDNGDDQKEKLLELEKQETTRDQASEKESPPPVTGSWTASDTASLIASMNEPPLFQVKNEIDDGPSTVTEAPASHLIKKEEPPDDLLNPSSVTNAGPIQDDDKPLKKETDSNPSTSKSKKVVVSIPIPKGLPRSGAMVPNFETLCYSNLNSVFLYLFDIPNERTYLRPDIVNNVISETPGMPLKQFVRVNRQTVGEKEMWQLGEQRPIDSSILKEIKLHRCKNASPLKINGTMLQLWLSLLLHCPKCILMGSWTLAMEKMQGFVAEEEKKWKAKQANEARPETKLAYVRRLAEEKRRKAAVDEMDNEKYYNRLNSIFFQLFCIPDERRYLRPDIRKTQFEIGRAHV